MSYYNNRDKVTEDLKAHLPVFWGRSRDEVPTDVVKEKIVKCYRILNSYFGLPEDSRKYTTADLCLSFYWDIPEPYRFTDIESDGYYEAWPLTMYEFVQSL